MMTLPLIQIIAASKAYPTHDGGIFHALQQINLDIAAGDIFGLIGKSGAGKSSLLRLINLLERPDTGSIIVASQDLTQLNKKALRRARQQIGMIFQQFNLLQNTNVFDNVAFPLKIHGGLKNRISTPEFRNVSQLLVLKKRRTAIRRNSPAAKSNVLLLHARWHHDHKSCYAMNPLRPSMQKQPVKFLIRYVISINDSGSRL